MNEKEIIKTLMDKKESNSKFESSEDIDSLISDVYNAVLVAADSLKRRLETRYYDKEDLAYRDLPRLRDRVEQEMDSFVDSIFEGE